MRAIILAGGIGTRLAPYTTIFPKPLMPIGNMPILEIVMRQLASHGFQDLTLAVGYLAELLMAYCGDGSKFNVHLDYSREDEPLGTAGPLALVPNLNETFLVMNGDLLTTINYSSMLDYHRKRGAIATLARYQRDVEIDLGVIESNSDGWLSNYIEKPTLHYAVSMGIYIFEPEIMAYIPYGQRLDLPELLKKLLAEGQQVNTFEFNGYWLDIGRHEDYEKAISIFAENRGDFLPPV
ncbi:MAG: NTP transferase domain-containing protein [Anaerolineales bacterium]|nr:NTP transferase domain-containing protein [Anaerolineales bacterium]